MKILMLGWEYPPHISGGLGTACEGLTTALAKLGVEIDFVVPHLIGNEEAPHMQLVDAWRTDVPPPPSIAKRLTEVKTLTKTPAQNYTIEQNLLNIEKISKALGISISKLLEV